MQRPLLTLLLTLALALIAPAQIPYGTGIPGSTGVVPTLSSGQAWMGYSGFSLRIDSGLPGAVAYVVLASQPAAISVGTTPIWVSPNALLLVDTVILDGNGSATYPLPLNFPVISGLAGLSLFAQALVLDFGGPQGGPAATAGLDIRLTMDREVFIGTSVGGSADPHYLVDPDTLTLDTAGTMFTNNCSGVAFTEFGKELYVSSSIGQSITHADVTDPTNPVWSTFVSIPGSIYGLAHDANRKLLWTLVDTMPGTSSPARELRAYDVDPNGTYGAIVGQTIGASSLGWVERWALSNDGNMAAVLQVFGSAVLLFDLDPQSPTYLTQVGILSVPTSIASGFRLNTQVAFTADDAQLLVLIQHAGSTPGELARYSFQLGGWLDHDPATFVIDNLGANSSPPVALGSAPVGLSQPAAGGAVYLSGFGGNGWAGRLDLPLDNPFVWAWIPAGGASVPNAWACGVDADGTTLAVTSWSPSRVVFFDTQTMTSIGQVPLPNGSNIYFCQWR